MDGRMDGRTDENARGSSLDARLMEIIGSSAAETRARRSIRVSSSERQVQSLDFVDEGNFTNYFNEDLKYQIILFFNEYYLILYRMITFV